MNTRKKISGFTLVELIVVVTILSILSTIGFVSYSGYLSGVRDTSRIRALAEIEKSMQTYSTNKNLPKPDKHIEIKEGTKTVAYQGEAGQTVIDTIKYSTDGKDPKDKTYYTYYLTKNKKHFQLLSHLEEDPELTQKTWVNKAQASIDYETRYPYVQGAKLGILTTDENKPIQETISGSLDITDNTKTANLKSYLKTNESFTGSTNIEKLGLIAKVGGYGYSASGNTLTYTDYTKDGPTGNEKSCKEVLEAGGTTDGTYTINPTGSNSFQVYCDQTTDGGGWTLVAKFNSISSSNMLTSSEIEGLSNLNSDIGTPTSSKYLLRKNMQNFLEWDSKVNGSWFGKKIKILRKA